MEIFYSVAIRPRTDAMDRFYYHQNFQFQEVKLNCRGRYWLADPFIFEKDGEVYLFYEAYDLISEAGRIAYSMIDKDGNATYPRVVIHDRSHFSFPYIFEHEGEIYIMPETSSKDAVYLYRAVSFPDKWVKDQTLIQNEYVVDSIFLDETSKNQLLGSVQYRVPPEGRVIACWVKNTLFERNTNEIKQQLIREGEYGIRNAGKIYFDKEGKRIRPGQDCSGGIYGKGLVFWHMDDNFNETEIYHINATEMQNHIQYVSEKKIIGTYTYNASEHYEVIDFSYYADVSQSISLAGTVYRFARRMYKSIKRMIKM